MSETFAAHTPRDVLSRYRTLAVVGLSPQWHRPSYFTAKYMQAHGYRIVPVNPVAAEVRGTLLGERVYASLTHAEAGVRAEGQRIEIVGCFRKSDEIASLIDEAIAIAAPCVWLPKGVANEAAVLRARQAGIQVVQDRCVKAEHTRLFGGPGWSLANTRAATSPKRRRQLPY